MQGILGCRWTSPSNILFSKTLILVVRGAVLGSGKHNSMCLFASLLFSFHMECFSEIIWLLLPNTAFKLISSSKFTNCTYEFFWLLQQNGHYSQLLVAVCCILESKQDLLRATTENESMSKEPYTNAQEHEMSLVYPYDGARRKLRGAS